MQLVCPACETVYDVPASALRAGRVLRCARCRHEWAPILDDPLPIAADASAAMPAAPALANYPSPSSTGQGSSAIRAEVMAAWFLTFLLLSAGIAELLYWRASIIKAWPPSERAYALLGYH